MDERRQRSGGLSARLLGMSDGELMALIEDAEPTFGWGTSRVVEVDGESVFVKRLPVTDVELTHHGSTRDRFDLPTNYHYGVGSAGFGAWRELMAHRRASGWVASGRCPHFPLLYHHRLLPLVGQTRQRTPEQLDRYVAAWGGSLAVRRFIEAREASTSAIVLFAEHVPHVLMDWLPSHQDAIDSVIDQVLVATDVLRTEGVAHLDLNPSNVLTDDTTIVIADFGLFLDPGFDLGQDELEFLDSHRWFDIGEFIASLGWPVPGRSFEAGAAYRAALEPFGPLIDEMTTVFERLAADRSAPSTYDDERTRQLLATCRAER